MTGDLLLDLCTEVKVAKAVKIYVVETVTANWYCSRKLGYVSFRERVDGNIMRNTGKLLKRVMLQVDIASYTKPAATIKVPTNTNATDPQIGTKLVDQTFVPFQATSTTADFTKQETKARS